MVRGTREPLRLSDHGSWALERERRRLSFREDVPVICVDDDELRNAFRHFSVSVFGSRRSARIFLLNDQRDKILAGEDAMFVIKIFFFNICCCGRHA